MDLLSDKINKNSYVYNLILRGEKAIIYEQIEPEENVIVGYEVFRRKIDKPKVVFGVELGEREVFPGNEDFGKWAWSITDKERALDRFKNLENS
jgi:hypothetical protein